MTKQPKALATLSAALAESEARVRAVLATAVDGIITCDELGVIDEFNPAAERIFGYRAEEVIGRHVAVLGPQQPQEQHHIGTFPNLSPNGVPVGHQEVVGARKDGSLVPLEISVSEVAIGEKRWFTGFVRDITQRKEADAALRELQRLSQQRERLADVGAITAKILHDLANPLAGVSMQAQLILRRAARDPQQPVSGVLHPAAQILSEVQRLDALIGELKDFARDQRLELRPLALNAFLQECIDGWRPLARLRNIGIHLDAPDDLPELRADRVKLRRVFDNLLKNAIEAMDQGPGIIRVRGEVIDGAKVRVAVEDTGPGIPDSVQPFRLFDTTKPYGTGLGLAIAKQIVQAHGGTIEYAPVQPRGAAFLLELAQGGPPPIT